MSQIGTALSKAREKRAKEQAGQTALGFSDKALKDTSLQPGFDVWVEGHYNSYDDDLGGGDRSGNLGVVYLGADYLITPAVLIGAIVQWDWADEDSDILTSDIDGDGWMAGPYLSAKLSENLFFDIRAAWGQSDNDIRIGTVTGSFDTDRWLVRGNLTGNWQEGAWRITPSVGLVYAEEDQENYTNSAGTFVASQTVSLGRVSFGPEIAYRSMMADGTVIEPHVSIIGLWDFDNEDNLVIGGVVASTDDFRAKIEGGVIVKIPNGLTVRATGNYDGIGADDFDAWGGQLWINLPLN